MAQIVRAVSVWTELFVGRCGSGPAVLHLGLAAVQPAVKLPAMTAGTQTNMHIANNDGDNAMA